MKRKSVLIAQAAALGAVLLVLLAALSPTGAAALEHTISLETLQPGKEQVS